VLSGVLSLVTATSMVLEVWPALKLTATVLRPV
jgi:hypothetical protein